MWSGRRQKSSRTLGRPDKGQNAELSAFFEAVRTGGPMPILLGSLVATTRATLAVDDSLANGTTERL